jgi:hypothetical protein
LLFGKLNLPLEALRVIEEISTTPEEMQKNMGYVSECDSSSNTLCNKTQLLKKNLSPLASSADACAAAADIYECGKKKAPALTSAIQDNLKNAAAVAVPVGVRQTFIDCCLISP